MGQKQVVADGTMYRAGRFRRATTALPPCTSLCCEGTVLEFHADASKVAGFKTRAKRPCVLVQWDVEHESADCCFVLEYVRT